MGEIRIHLHHELVTVGQGDGERRQVGATQALLSRAAEHPYALFTCGDLVCETSCPIGRIVVYDQDVDVGRRREDTVRDGAEVVAFVYRSAKRRGRGVQGATFVLLEAARR
jgi:hypothetical protein